MSFPVLFSLFATQLTLVGSGYSIAPAANAYAITGAIGGTSGQRIWIVQAVSQQSVMFSGGKKRLPPDSPPSLAQQGVPSIVTGPIMAIVSDVYGRRWV